VHDAGAATNGSSGSIYIEGSFGKLTMGDVDGAAEVAVGNLPMASLTGLGDSQDINYLSDFLAPSKVDNPRAQYTYTTGGLTFAASFQDGLAGLSSVDSGNVWALGVKYVMGDYTFGLGYESFDPAGAGASVDHILGSVNATFGTTTVTAYYGSASDFFDFKQYGIGVASTFDALTVKGYAKKNDSTLVVVTTYGLGAEYDLGGGAKLVGGIADNDIGGDTIADFGLSFSF
jgi:outer membrane protein OmpU